MNNYLFWKRFAQGKLKTHVSSVKIRIPSPKEILSWSERSLPNSTLVGKIENAHTVEHDTLRPVPGGLFCERVFGPIATNVCACLRRKGWRENYCKICEVEFTKSRIRRYQMGHILLAAPVVHIWALQGGFISSLLGKKNSVIRSITYGKIMCHSKICNDTLTQDVFSNPFSLPVLSPLKGKILSGSVCFPCHESSMQKMHGKERLDNQKNKIRKIYCRENVLPFHQFLLYKPDTFTKITKFFNSIDKEKLMFPLPNYSKQKISLQVQHQNPLRLTAKTLMDTNLSKLNFDQSCESFAIALSLLCILYIFDVKATQIFLGKKGLTKLNKILRIFSLSFLGLLNPYDTIRYPKYFWQSTRSKDDPSSSPEVITYYPKYKVSTFSWWILSNPILRIGKNRKASNIASLSFPRPKVGIPLPKKIWHQVGSLQSSFTSGSTCFDCKVVASTGLKIIQEQPNKQNFQTFLEQTKIPFNKTKSFLTSSFPKDFGIPKIFSFSPRLYLSRQENLGTKENTKKPSHLIQKKFKVPPINWNFQKYKMSKISRFSIFSWGSTKSKFFCSSADSCEPSNLSSVTTYPLFLPSFLTYLFEEKILAKLLFTYGFIRTLEDGRITGSTCLPLVITPKNKKDFRVITDLLGIRSGIMKQVNSRLDKVITPDRYQQQEIAQVLLPPTIPNISCKIGETVTFQNKNLGITSEIRNLGVFNQSDILRWGLPLYPPNMNWINRINWIFLQSYIFGTSSNLASLILPSPLLFMHLMHLMHLRCNSNSKSNSKSSCKFSFGSLIFTFGITGRTESIKVPKKQVDKSTKLLKKVSLSNRKDVIYTGSSIIYQTLNNLNLLILESLIDWKYKKAKNKLNYFLLQNKLTKKKRNIRNKLAKAKIGFSRRKSLTRSFLNTGQLPKWMILSILPVLPPALRPILELEPNNVVVSDLNVLYQSVIRRNDALIGLITFRSMEIDILTRQVSLQQAIERLFDKGGGTKKRPVKSLSQGFHGKRGLFRSNLLGKRVDYSGRSVIVVGPKLKLYECGLPKEMALVLFLPFLIARLKKCMIIKNTSQAKQLILQKDKRIWNHLKSLIYEHPVLLNRAPTLHRLGFQAFQPQLVAGKAMILPALVCTGFNADFDGDQMAVHIPLCHRARAESWKLLHAKNNMLSPATGKPIIVLSQEMILGCYCSSLILNNSFTLQLARNKLQNFNNLYKSRCSHISDVKHQPVQKEIRYQPLHVIPLPSVSYSKKGSLLSQNNFGKVKSKALSVSFAVHASYASYASSMQQQQQQQQQQQPKFLWNRKHQGPKNTKGRIPKSFEKKPTHLMNLEQPFLTYLFFPILSYSKNRIRIGLERISERKNIFYLGFYFTTFQEVYKALGEKQITLQTPIWLRMPFFEDNQSLEKPLEIRLDVKGNFFRSYRQSQRHFPKNTKSKNQMKGLSYIRTSIGRIQLNEIFYSSFS